MATMTAAAINDLPDSDFAYIEPGGEKDDQGKTTPRSLRHFPIHDAAHVRNALARAPQSPFGDKAMPKIRAAAKKFDIELGDDDTDRSAVDEQGDVVERGDYARTWALDDIQIVRTGQGGDGRTVEAYAAVFGQPAEIHDRHGDYFEVIDKKAFNRQLGLGIERVGVYYHHGMTLHGTPSDLGSVPIGSPVSVTTDQRGLRTVSRFNRSELADSVLEAIRNGDVRGYSFRGAIFKSNPSRMPRKARDGSLPTIVRTELGLVEYGPTPTPAYMEAGILALRALLAPATSMAIGPWNQAGQSATPTPGLGAEDQPDGHSGRLHQRHLALKRALRERGLA